MRYLHVRVIRGFFGKLRVGLGSKRVVMAGSMPMADAGDAGSFDECSLVARCHAGDRAAFAQLVQTHQQRVTSLAWRLLGWGGDIQDAVQDVFLTALRKLPEFRGDCQLSTWLFRITVNRCRRRRRRLGHVHWPADDGPVATTPTGDLQQRETCAEVRSAIGRLKVGLREVVVLRYLHDLPIDEIGMILGLSRTAVEVRLSRARQRLRELLVELLEE